MVEQDEALLEVVTDKVNAEIPSPMAGRLVRINVAEGATVAVGTELALLEVESADAADPTPEPAAPSTPAPVASGGAARSVPGISADSTRFSPAVRRLALEHSVDLDRVAGTGAEGRITKDDVLAHVAAGRGGAADRDAELVPLDPVRRSIAQHMVRSLATSPHAWTMQEVDASALVEHRNAHGEDFQARHGASLTYPVMVARALVDALSAYPQLNSTWSEEGILIWHRVNLGLAVSLDDGLLVPVLASASGKSLAQIAQGFADLVGRARTHRLGVDDVRGGTFTLNNTGATGSVLSQPIINQPQAAILTMEAIVPRAVVVGGQVVVRRMMNVCLSFDHRIIDGMIAGRFLTDLKQRLEDWNYSDD